MVKQHCVRSRKGAVGLRRPARDGRSIRAGHGSAPGCGRSAASPGRRAGPPQRRPGLRIALASTTGLLLPGLALANRYGMDRAPEDARAAAADLWVMLFLFAVLAFAVHLAAKTRALGALQHFAKGLTFLASIYLSAFFFLSCLSGIARFLHFFGMERDLASLVAFPFGLAMAFKLYTVYERWRVQKK